MCDCEGAFLNGGGAFFFATDVVVGSFGNFEATRTDSGLTAFLYCDLTFECLPDVDGDGDEIDDTDDTFGIFFVGRFELFSCLGDDSSMLFADDSYRERFFFWLRCFREKILGKCSHSLTVSFSFCLFYLCVSPVGIIRLNHGIKLIRKTYKEGVCEKNNAWNEHL